MGANWLQGSIAGHWRPLIECFSGVLLRTVFLFCLTRHTCFSPCVGYWLGIGRVRLHVCQTSKGDRQRGLQLELETTSSSMIVVHSLRRDVVIRLL